MEKEIKIRLLKLDKKQTDLLKILHKKGFSGVDKSRLSAYINGVLDTPQAKEVIKVTHEILSEWENKNNQQERTG